MTDGNMYKDAKTWNPWKGCFFGCTYCIPTFQRQAKRQKHLCDKCYEYTPHAHPDRLTNIPSAPIVFVCGASDLAFATPEFISQIIETITKRNAKRPDQTYYFQSKSPGIFAQHIHELTDNMILLTTLETNRDVGYAKISDATLPTQRWQDFASLNWPRKVVTIEPVMAFDPIEFAHRIIEVRPEYVWIGFNSHPKEVQLPEPSTEQVVELIHSLHEAGIPVRGKTLRGIAGLGDVLQ